MAWSDVDRDGGTVTLRAEHSKNGEPRTLPLAGELADLIERRWAAREIRSAEGAVVTLSPLVFHRGGAAVGDFRKAWRQACKAAKLPGLLVHDLRRSAIREMDKAGVRQTVAMRVSGHKTTSTWRRYRITDADEVQKALMQTEAAIHAQQEQSRKVVEFRRTTEGQHR
jgi:integrase